jgi:hypothetical protein
MKSEFTRQPEVLPSPPLFPPDVTYDVQQEHPDIVRAHEHAPHAQGHQATGQRLG